MRILVACAAGALAVVWLGHSSPAEAYTRYHAKNSSAWVRTGPPRRSYIELPPGYSRGGPNYTACDRINRDRMLVGTCR